MSAVDARSLAKVKSGKNDERASGCQAAIDAGVQVDGECQPWSMT